MNKNVYVFAEQREGVIQPVALELLGKARDLADVLGEKVVAILAGYQIADKANELIAYGADDVIVVDAPELKDYITEQYTQAVYTVINEMNPNVVLFGATTIGRDLAPRLSARLEKGLTADCTKLEISDGSDPKLPANKLMMTRPAFGGNLMATIVAAKEGVQMATVRPGVMQKKDKDETRTGNVISYNVTFDSSKFAVKLLETVKADKGLVDITEAKILVSGGRGVGCKEGFDKLTALAQVLDAEVSSSRAMVDAGIMPHDRQVGQTGKTVRPNLYFAMGISGAIQHLAGMEESDLIIAVNKDKFAPIFNVADMGIVGDVNKIVPMLTDRLQKELKK
ncbi:MAG: electron transfer flavoprotein subunit alpha/FixB family protein [Bacteroidales bacterium]|nr:electron transfer flavoprotein subunit alpha/FixB family protein [Bacteroidales bacterium]MBO7321791.1 electron transfer flavoprotein subunit alpha/FixB family protein [Bacteroidales bacterium]MBQ2243990.1 electron transfer flavoprotein subunit alpha/FixB family protein [Bacteroidales bacterium]